MDKSTTCKRVRPPAFKVEIPGDTPFKETFLGKLQKMRDLLVSKLQRPVNNGDIIGIALDAWIDKNGGSMRRKSLRLPLLCHCLRRRLARICMWPQKVSLQTVGDRAGAHKVL